MWCAATGSSSAATDPMAKCISLRYDEFTSKDPVAKAKVVRATLVHLGALDAKLDDTALAPAGALPVSVALNAEHFTAQQATAWVTDRVSARVRATARVRVCLT